jgi:hypothetical protein
MKEPPPKERGGPREEAAPKLKESQPEATRQTQNGNPKALCYSDRGAGQIFSRSRKFRLSGYFFVAMYMCKNILTP